jgi:hypothetical protein
MQLTRIFGLILGSSVNIAIGIKKCQELTSV